MRKRLVVLNGYRVSQVERGDEWINQGVEKAPTIPPGVYELFQAQCSDRHTATTGWVVAIEDGLLYLGTTAQVVSHASGDFAQPPAVGAHGTVVYDTESRASFEPAPEPRKKRAL